MSNHQAPEGSRISVRRLLPLALLAAGLGAFLALDLGRYASIDTLREHREALAAWVGSNAALAALAYMGVYTMVIAFSLPGGAPMTLAGGFLFGIWFGTLWTVIGATLGATLIFLAARTGLGDPLRARAGKMLRRMEAGFQENALSYLLVLRLVPIFPFWAVNLVPAFLGVRLRTYMLGTFVGIIPGTFVYASVGNGLGEILDQGGSPDLGLVFNPEVLLPLLGLALLALVPVVYKRVKGRPAAGSERR